MLDRDELIKEHNLNNKENVHTFHIPVMGTGFTVDTSLKVARYGISSVATIGDDVLLEQMRELHSKENHLEFTPISFREDNYRARRVTAYLNMLDIIVEKQFEDLQNSDFVPKSEITRYFRLLPQSPLKDLYNKMMACQDPAEKEQMQEVLRQSIMPGSIDVNIMTKIDGFRYKKGKQLPPEEAVAMSALRGFAESNLSSSIVLSAGMNPRLFAYMAEFKDFFPNESGFCKKKIVLKVSDYRSAMIQGKIFAKKGLWVSEFRIESGLNCGGHAFANKGHLVGSILKEFQNNRETLSKELFQRCKDIASSKGITGFKKQLTFKITYQGGIGTSEEDNFIRHFYEIDGTGWGTPFLLVPEATNVDDEHLQRLIEAKRDDIILGENSPLGVPFWNLKTSNSEKRRLHLIEEENPGSLCPKGFLSSNTEFTEVPICHASRAYQRKKVKALSEVSDKSIDVAIIRDEVLKKTCLCMDLAAGALIKNKIMTNVNTAICCGPGIVDFNKIISLEEMIDHIYGRKSVMDSTQRAHVFITELQLYIDFLKKEMERNSKGLIQRTEKYFIDFKQNISTGIEYYSELASQFSQQKKEQFIKDLESASERLAELLISDAIRATA
ncbi:MAG: hypothetical protein KAR42_08325 [candidate division Zixibacteria bacterium]|nr:hypothetical protein [candidate division Zixibacteria bacterium]